MSDKEFDIFGDSSSLEGGDMLGTAMVSTAVAIESTTDSDGYFSLYLKKAYSNE